MSNSEPSYEKAFEHKNRRKIIKTIAEAGGAVGFSKIMQATGVKDKNPSHHLNVLIQYGIIEKYIAEGPYALRYKTPLYFIFGKNPEREKISYIGLPGEREGRTEPETTVALKLLKKSGLEASLVYIVTSTAGVNSWKDDKLEAQWILCDGDAITDIDKIRKKVGLITRELIKEHLVIMDCTSLNKPATIAFYQLAQKYLIPLIYVYEPQHRLKWLISRNS